MDKDDRLLSVLQGFESRFSYIEEICNSIRHDLHQIRSDQLAASKKERSPECQGGFPENGETNTDFETRDITDYPKSVHIAESVFDNTMQVNALDLVRSTSDSNKSCKQPTRPRVPQSTLRIVTDCNFTLKNNSNNPSLVSDSDQEGRRGSSEISSCDHPPFLPTLGPRRHLQMSPAASTEMMNPFPQRATTAPNFHELGPEMFGANSVADAVIVHQSTRPVAEPDILRNPSATTSIPDSSEQSRRSSRESVATLDCADHPAGRRPRAHPFLDSANTAAGDRDHRTWKEYLRTQMRSGAGLRQLGRDLAGAAFGIGQRRSEPITSPRYEKKNVLRPLLQPPYHSALVLGGLPCRVCSADASILDSMFLLATSEPWKPRPHPRVDASATSGGTAQMGRRGLG